MVYICWYISNHGNITDSIYNVYIITIISETTTVCDILIYGHGQILPPKESDVLDKKVDHYALPTTNTTSSITSTVISTSTSGDTVTSPITTAPIGMTTPDRRDPTNMYKSGYNTSRAEMRKRFEEGKPNQALTLFAPVGMAEE